MRIYENIFLYFNFGVFLIPQAQAITLTLQKSDFDGDGAIDYAVDVLDKKDGYKILVFLAKGDIINLGGWEFIELDKSRGPFSDIAEKETTLENDSIAGIRCESSSVILVYNRTTNGFDEFWTGD